MYIFRIKLQILQFNKESFFKKKPFFPFSGADSGDALHDKRNIATLRVTSKAI